MSHDFKRVGFALSAVLVMSAMAASIAAAQQGRLTSDGPLKLNVTQTGAVGSGVNALTAFGDKIECPASIYSGYKYNVTPHELLEKTGATVVTLVPTYINCFSESSGVAFSATLDVNGCDFVLHIGEVTGGEDAYGVTTDIACPEGQVIQATMFAGPSHLTKICTLNIKPQNGLSGAQLISNTAADDLTIGGTVKSIHIEKTGICGAETIANGELDIDVTVKGNSGTEPTGITVTS